MAQLKSPKSSGSDETYYDILKVDPKATIAEIVAAYHTAKNAFSRDSIATYSLFSPEESQSILNKLEEAYLNLSNIDKKRDYDRRLAEQEADASIPGFSELEQSQARDSSLSNAFQPPPTAELTAPSRPTAAAPAQATEEALSQANTSSAASVLHPSDQVTGITLREIREKRALSAEDVSRITKIPSKFIRAIESDDLKKLPARVYLQGFVKNLVALYKLDTSIAVKAYLEHVDRKLSEAEAK